MTVLIPTSTVRNLTIEKSFSEDSNNPDIDFDGEGDDDQAEFHADNNESTHPAVQSRWPTRVSAVPTSKRDANTGAAMFLFSVLFFQIAQINTKKKRNTYK